MTESPEYLTDIPAPFSMQAMRAAWAMPWKARNELLRLLALPLIRAQVALAGLRWGRGWRLYGAPILQLHRAASVQIGARLSLRSWTRSNPLAPNHAVLISARRPDAVLTIGADFSMTGGVIVAEQRITIGDRVMVGANCSIVDTDFHPLDAATRQADPIAGATAPITIEDDVFIGMDSLILKGAHIGAGSVIGARSVVTGRIPAGVIAAGNPAKVLRRLDPTPPLREA
jgi:acetyltransferase-like isoleucine patch superfamily enzyme